MELGTKRPSLVWFVGPNSTAGVYMDPLGKLAPENLARLLPKRYKMVFNDWIGTPEGHPPFRA